MSVHKIAAFGCWNNNKLVNGRIPMKNVTDYLKTVQSNYSDLIILGDNYYPQKVDKIQLSETQTIKKKVFEQDKFQEGFDMVESIDIPKKFLIMGNHDVEDTLLDNCVGLQVQKAKSSIFNIKFPYGTQEVVVKGTKYKYIFIDTSIYNLLDKGETCFDKVERKSASELMVEQNEFLRRELEDTTIKTFLIFGHEPLVSLKSKFIEEQEIKKQNFLLNEELLKLLFDSNKDIIYVCADVHMYQNSMITNNESRKIKQIVCGTGGGDKDYYCLSSRIMELGDANKYNFELINFVDPYGYVEIILTENNVTHSYIKVDKDLGVKKFSRKYFINYSN
jgi:hypothetical protein